MAKSSSMTYNQRGISVKRLKRLSLGGNGHELENIRRDSSISLRLHRGNDLYRGVIFYIVEEP
jgi:hypothetical protein